MNQQQNAPPTNDDISTNNEQNNSTNQNIDVLIEQHAKEAMRQVVHELGLLDEVKNVVEEEVEKQIISEELNPLNKIRDKIIIAIHLQLLPHFFRRYKKEQKPLSSEQIQYFHNAVVLLFGLFKEIPELSDIFYAITEIIIHDYTNTEKRYKELHQKIHDAIFAWLYKDLESLNQKGFDFLIQYLERLPMEYPQYNVKAISYFPDFSSYVKS